ncbi:DNA-directed RNA polymerase subunit beta [Nocardia sp. NPDC049149]|uniref:DNA-directed RNA polymerase subunit beta n=1 Tax=Nocardia sp. NPDC049149 TaxID=3364315 RepID=UPI00371CD8DC
MFDSFDTEFRGAKQQPVSYRRKQGASNTMEHIPNEDTPLTRCSYYREMCGLPAKIDPPTLGRITFRAGSIGALTMPAPLGDTVRMHMLSHGSTVGPIIANLGSNRWTYLIRPDLPDTDVRLSFELERADVTVVRTGSIVLPSPTAESWAQRRWIRLPHNSVRSSGLRVVEVVRAFAWIDRDSRTMVMPRVR